MSDTKNNKKVIYDLSPEDLIKLATGSKEEVVMDKLTEAAKFIYDLNIKHGDEKISAQVIYHAYKKYRNYSHVQPKIQFFSDFKKYFQPGRNKDGIYYLLNPKPFDLSDDAYWEMRALERKEKAYKRRKKQR
jgi:hypothetical protein